MTGTQDFLLPDLGEGLTEGEIVSWLVAVGDPVEIDQPVAEVETAKAVVEVPSPFAGTVTALHAEVGQQVAVGRPLVSVRTAAAADDVEDVPDVSGPGAPPEDAAFEDLVPDASAGQEAADGGSGNVLVGYGTGGAGRTRRRRGGRPPGAGAAPGVGAGAPLAPAHAASAPGRPLATPPVRKLAKDMGVDLAAVRGSGPQGSVTRDDVHAAADPGEAAAGAPPPVTVPTTQPRPRLPGDGEGVLVTSPDRSRLGSAPPNEERIPVRGVRRAISEKMSTSRREIPEATCWVDVDATALMDLRTRLNTRQDAVRVSPLALVLRAAVAGLRENPTLNARLDTAADEIVVPSYVHLGFAAQTDRGLVVPVIRDADRRSTLGLAQELNRLAGAAREGRVTPEDLRGGTFTVSNYGSFGVDGGSAIINHPEAAILGVGRIAERPWVVDGALEVRQVLQLSVAFDHRICDGGEAAGFLRFVADCVEDPTFLLASL